MQVYQQQKARALALCADAIAIAAKLEKPDVAERLAAESHRLTTESLSVAVVGECKRGKSSLINNLLDDTYCPIDVDITTCVVTRIRYGAEEQITVYRTDDEGRALPAMVVRRHEIGAYASEQRNPGNRENVALVDIETPCPALTDHLEFVDTPGVGGLNTAHSQITYQFIPAADVVLYVFTATDPLTSTELDFIGKILGQRKSLIFVMTKKDIGADAQRALDENRQKLAGVLGRPAQEITVVAVNNRAYELYRRSGDEEDRDRSNLDALRQALWAHLQNERGTIIIERAMVRLAEALDEIGMPLESELKALTGDSAEVQAMREELKRRKERRHRLLQDQADWHTSLTRDLGVLRLSLDAQLDEGLTSIDHALRQHIHDRRLQANPGDIETLINSDLAALGIQLQSHLEREAAEIYARLTTETELGLTERAFQLRAPTQVEGGVVVPEKESRAERLFEKVRSGITYVTPLAFVAAAAQVALNPFSLLGIGAFVFGWRRAKQQQEKADTARTIEALSAHFNPQFKRISLELRHAQKKVLQELEISLREQLRAEIKREHRVLEEALAGIEAALKATTLDAQKRRESILEPLRKMQDIDRSIRPLLATVRAQRHSAGAAGGGDAAAVAGATTES